MSDAKVATAAAFLNIKKTTTTTTAYNCKQEFDQRKYTKNGLVFREQTCLRHETSEKNHNNFIREEQRIIVTYKRIGSSAIAA